VQENAPGLYGTYASYKGYRTPELGSKHMRRFDDEIWRPAECRHDMSFLEIGCGTGAFLAFLAAKGVSRLVGIDHDPALADIVPASVRAHFTCRDLRDALADPAVEPFDRVVALDVFEHFTADEALSLLSAIAGKLNDGGRVVLKVPNAASPWGASYQYGDLTHRTAFTPLSMRQLADAAGFRVHRLAPQRQGSRRRLVTDALVHRFLSWALLTPPEIWSANFYAVLERRS
jgi:cyclopropane fatty-acyl-phospholipid synthase-like methyltransferase